MRYTLIQLVSRFEISRRAKEDALEKRAKKNRTGLARATFASPDCQPCDACLRKAAVVMLLHGAASSALVTGLLMTLPIMSRRAFLQEAARKLRVRRKRERRRWEVDDFTE
ncbi:uncharacterized protein RCC_05323 [Ramularia collo-cygni]|uniref:Uncharacterized protein n=1 Tax=Ramularia collo-cygni TaxID=112498 RepID=A0A2D3UR20_9PEZI|nr:uncharacterized protein RCC_05323 [Ramularia collo-cygni]CZT19472.1 uncharacterized protein RCC_05323 [Ramularia collo-cygni]